MEEKSNKPPAEGGNDAKPAADKKSRDPRPDGKGTPASAKIAEVGGPKGPDPTRYGDWERKGRCIDF